MSIERIQPVGLPPSDGSGAAHGPAEGGFADALSKVTQAVEQSGADANQAVVRMIDGEGEVHDAMIALQRADLMLQLTVQIRNKLVQAYQEIMRMPV